MYQVIDVYKEDDFFLQQYESTAVMMIRVVKNAISPKKNPRMKWGTN